MFNIIKKVILLPSILCSNVIFANVGSDNRVVNIQSKESSVKSNDIIKLQDHIALNELKLKLSHTNSFKASFLQQVTDLSGNILQNGSGNIALAYPSKIHWAQTSPDETLFTSDGKKSFYYDSFAEQVTVLKTSDLIDTTPFVLLTTREESQWQKYTVTKSKLGFLVTPNKGIESKVEALEIIFSENDSINSLLVTDFSGQTSTYVFEDVQSNIKLPESLFTFEIPKGVEIDDQTLSN